MNTTLYLRSTLLSLALVGLPLTSAQALGTLTIGPYIQNVSEQAVTVMARTESAEVVALYYRILDGDNWHTMTDSTATTEHRFRIGSLHRHRTYEYYLSDSEGRLTQTYTFNTERNIKKKNPLRIAVLGDSGDGSTYQYRIALLMSAWQPELFLHTGDIAYENGTASEYITELFKPYQTMLAEIPFYGSIGNHDYASAQAGPYKDYFETPNAHSDSEDYYSFDYDTIHIVSLNANISYAVDSEQYNWLAADLASEQAQAASWRIVFFHQPVFSSSNHASTTDMWTTIQPVFENNNVDLVLNGHDHDYERNEKVNGVKYIVTGGGGNDALYGQDHPELNPYSQLFISTHHFLGMTVTNGYLKIQAINIDGQIIDSFTMKR